jgi:Mn-dependent DtxR family transcriptional regulator
MIDLEQILQAIASSGSKSSTNSQEIAQKLEAKLLDVEMLLHRMQEDGDVELELIRDRVGFAFAVKMTKQGRTKLKR